MTSIKMKDQDLLEYFTKTIQDPYIKKCVGEPEIPVCFVEMLEELLALDTTTPKESMYMWSIASILLQMGVEMHTSVSIEAQLGTAEKKLRQQYVLAGDYFSSLFYRLLAEHNELDGLAYFSQVIRSINQDKLSLHMKWRKTKTYDQEMIKNLKSVTSGLLMAVADFFHVQEDFLSQWKKAASMYLFIDYLERRKEWVYIPTHLRQEIERDWYILLDHLKMMTPHCDGQRLFALLNQKSSFVKRLSVKES